MSADWNDIRTLQQRMAAAVDKLEKLIPAVAKARQVKEFFDERRKAALAKVMAPLLADNSAAAAEVLARSNPEYHEDMKALAAQQEAAERTIAEWYVEQTKFEATRSLLSVAKETLKTV